MKQLKYKFENMKRSAKKVASRERQEMRRTGGGNPPSLPPDSEDATDWLRSIMSGSIDGNEAIYDDDIISPNSIVTIPIIHKDKDFDEIPPIQKKVKLDTNTDSEIQHDMPNILKDVVVNTIITDQDKSFDNVENIVPDEVFDASAPHSSLKRPVAPQLSRIIKKKQGKSENIIKQALREKKLTVLDGLHELEMEKIKLSISHQNELHSQLLRHNEEKHKLEVDKLKLEIDILRRKNKF
ncbi:uncharacterized protein LOC135118254 [Helicoverpa armigera]|uniref:uncharacterized protein LOC135118254 n=1 Tax=Helicoverpa armigera TaxID=29058 RepID=UPI0030833834